MPRGKRKAGQAATPANNEVNSSTRNRPGNSKQKDGSRRDAASANTENEEGRRHDTASPVPKRTRSNTRITPPAVGEPARVRGAGRPRRGIQVAPQDDQGDQHGDEAIAAVNLPEEGNRMEVHASDPSDDENEGERRGSLLKLGL